MSAGRFKIRYHKLKALGLCVICGKSPADNGVRCEACAKAHVIHQHRRDTAKFYRSRVKRAAHTVEKIETLFELGRKMTYLHRQMTWARSA